MLERKREEIVEAIKRNRKKVKKREEIGGVRGRGI